MALKIERAASLILEAGQSGDLRAALQAVSEATTPDGAPRYSVKVCRTLNRLVVCRAYAVSALQLCHLVNIAEACALRRGAYEHLLMGSERATGAGFRGWITSAVTSRGWRRAGCDISREGVVVQYGDAVFNVGFARMPLLAAMFEFLCGTVGYASLDEEFCKMLQSPASDEAVRRTANGIERLLYAYLRENLPSVQMQGKFQILLDFAKFDTTAPELVVDDTIILEFWRQKSLDEEAGNFRLFRSAFDAYMAFLLALEVATDREAVGRARSVGADREADEIDVAALLENADSMDAWTSPLLVLQDASTESVKFLSKAEMSVLDRLMQHGPRSHRFPWSLARAEVFGDAQARLTQAVRRKVDEMELDTLINCEDAEFYQEWRDRLAKLAIHVNNTLRASLHVVIGSDELGGEDEPTDLRVGHPNRMAAQVDDVTENLPEHGRLEEAREDSRRAFKRIARRGFEDDALHDPGRAIEFEAGAGALAAIYDQIHSFLSVLDRVGNDGTDLASQFAYDREVFSEQFSLIYGARA